MSWDIPSEELCEKLDVIRLIAAKRHKAFKYVPARSIDSVDRELERLVRMKKLGRELCPGSYKTFAVTHVNHGTDAWVIYIAAGRSRVELNRENWKDFCTWVRSWWMNRPNSESQLMRKYPHCKVPE